VEPTIFKPRLKFKPPLKFYNSALGVEKPMVTTYVSIKKDFE